MPSRWEHLLEQKPVALVDHLLTEVSKLLAQDLSTWPLPISDLDPLTGAQFEPLLAPDARRPDPRVFEEAFRLARWELERDLDASAEYFRNQRFLEKGLGPGDRTTLLFVSRWLVEQLLSLREHTQSRLSRPQLIDCLELTWARLEGPPPVARA